MKGFSVDVVDTGSDDPVVLKPKGSLNSDTTPTLQAHLDEFIKKERHLVAVDLSETDFISSSGIMLLVAAASTLRAADGCLALMKVPGPIENILGIINVTEYFPMIDSVEELKNLARG